MTPDQQEALSTCHARDTFRLRCLTSGRWAIWDQTLTLIAIVDNLSAVWPATEHLRIRAEADAAQREAERFAILRRAEEQAALDNLELELDL